MRFMHWSWRDFQDCPARVVDAVFAEMRDEAEAIKRQNSRRR